MLCTQFLVPWAFKSSLRLTSCLVSPVHREELEIKERAGLLSSPPLESTMGPVFLRLCVVLSRNTSLTPLGLCQVKAALRPLNSDGEDLWCLTVTGNFGRTDLLHISS